MIKTFTLKTLWSSLMLSLITLTISETAVAQCANNNILYTDLTTSFNGDVQSTSCVYGGEYCTATVCAGVTYVFSTCGTTWDTQITLYTSTGTYLDYDDDGCFDANGGSYLEWTSTINGEIRILVDEYSCSSNSVCGNLSVTQIGSCSSACTNNNILYDVNATPTGPGNTVDVTCVFAGEYLNVNVCEGASYTFSTCGSTYDTQLSLYSSTGTFLGYDDDGCGGLGSSSLTWTATFTGTVRILLDQYNCTSNSTCTNVSITQNTSCSGGCNVNYAEAFYAGCDGDAENVTFYVNYDGACTVEGLYLYTNELGQEYIDLSPYFFTSNDPIGILLGVDNTTYYYTFVLSDGSTSLEYTYNSGYCSTSGCSFIDSSVEYLGCDGTSESVAVYPYYSGDCFVNGIWYNIGTGWFFIDLSVYGFVSGDAINILLAEDFTYYDYYFELNDGTTSPTYTYLTGACDLDLCVIQDVQYETIGCLNTDELVDFYVYYTGSCSVYSIWLYTSALGWEEIVLNGTFYSGDPIGILLSLDNTMYQYYFTLSDGTASLTDFYFTGTCDDIPCSNLLIDYVESDCYDTGVGNVPSGDIIPLYSGDCLVSGIYSSVDGGPYEYLDLSAYGYSSGDNMALLFNIADALYTVYYVLDDGTSSPTVTFITATCESGITICDCAGTQLPIEAMAWLGDGSFDDGTYYWNNDFSLPVDFSCATWGMDCGDGLGVGEYSYDPYGVCSGNMPPANGCVDEFCYNIDLDVTTDCYPNETSVFVYNQFGDVVFSADNLDYLTTSYTNYTFGMCLPAGCYTFEIFDSFGDGMSSLDCTADGFAGIWDYSSNSYVTYTFGDGFTYSFSGEFCVGPQSICDNLEMFISEEPCAPQGNELLPTISYLFDFAGPCTVQSLFYSINGGAFNEIDVSAENWGSGDVGYLYYMQQNSEYTIYYTTNDGASSFLYNYTTGDCADEITICDCAGTTLSIGVTSWLGDGFADNGFYQWGDQYVDFNCSTWGFDCGDIDGAPSIDPYGVCDGQLPPNNGCDISNEVLGCTDPAAVNYNPQATINDGSCIYDLLVGCTDVNACNYNEFAIVDDASCEYVTCAGCTDPAANNYDPTATIEDGSCIYLNIPGCTDPAAMNYDPLATTNDGSCIYDCEWPLVLYDAHCSQGDLDNFYIDVDVNSLGNAAPYTITNSENNQQQVMSLAGSFTMGPFPNGTPVVIMVTSNLIDCFLTSQPMMQDCSAGGVYGCTDPAADNYNPNATIDDGSCIISGCTDPEADNYDPAANFDDGSCIYTGVFNYDAAFYMMYPNPARDIVTITNKGSLSTITVRILDATGRLVSSEQLNINKGQSHNIDISNIAQGNYQLEINNENHTEHHALIIQR